MDTREMRGDPYPRAQIISLPSVLAGCEANAFSQKRVKDKTIDRIKMIEKMIRII